MAVEKFILQLEEEELKPTISQDVIDDIEKGVNIFVKLLTDEVSKEEKLFTIKRILKVGSFYEKTKVGNPDEFDFLLELDGTFEIEQGCKHNPCSAHVKIASPVFTNETLAETVMSTTGHLVAGATYSQWRKTVAKVLNKALNKENGLGKIHCEMGHLTFDAKLWGSGPNAEVGLVWYGTEGEKKEFEVGVDLSLCIPCTDALLEMWQNKFIPLNFSEMPRLVLVVPSQSRNKHNACRLGYKTDTGKFIRAEACWKISTTPIEVAKLRNIPEAYRLCYLVLKWLCKRREKPGSSNCTDSMLTLSSYMIKNAVLCCLARNELKRPVNCLEQVLRYLCFCSAEGFLPAYFMPSVNLWRFAGLEAIPPCDILDLLKTFLLKTLNEISGRSFRFRHARAKIRVLQRQFTEIEMDALNPKPLLALEDEPIEQ